MTQKRNFHTPYLNTSGLLFSKILDIFISRQNMRKEIIFAVVLGIILGGIILYGLRLANEATKDLTQSLSTPTPISENGNPPSQITPTPNPDNTIIITSPQNNFVSNENKITITGSAPKNTNLTIISEKAETIIETDENGKFNQEITLVGGENEITISGVINNEIKSTTITIIYTTAEIKP